MRFLKRIIARAISELELPTDLNELVYEDYSNVRLIEVSKEEAIEHAKSIYRNGGIAALDANISPMEEVIVVVGEHEDKYKINIFDVVMEDDSVKRYKILDNTTIEACLANLLDWREEYLDKETYITVFMAYVDNWQVNAILFVSEAY